MKAGAKSGAASLLVVDDNELNRDMLSRRLERQGYTVATAVDGARARALLAGQRFDLVLLDVMMPGISGLDLLREIRARHSAAELPVIMVTARDESEDIVQALELGANDYVTKPIDMAVALARIQTQLQLKRSREELQRVAARLDRSNRELKEFVSAVSHDLQEPLWRIKAAGQKLKDQYDAGLPGEAEELAVRIVQSAEWMQVMFDGLLSYAMVTNKDSTFRPVDLNKVLAQVLADLEMRLEQTGGRVAAEELPTVDADLLQMHQLLLNLVGNGLKYHRPGVPPLVKVSARLLSDHEGRAARDRWELVVEDNGIGFSELQAERIFNMFERLHDQGEYQGTGVGLAICRKIAEHHSGIIAARGLPGQGATFVVALPARRAQDGEEA